MGTLWHMHIKVYQREERLLPVQNLKPNFRSSLLATTPLQVKESLGQLLILRKFS